MTQPSVGHDPTPPTADAPAPGAEAVAAPGTPPIKATERPHPLTPFVRGWIVLVAIVFGFGRNLVEQAGNRDGGVGFGGLGVVLAVVAGIVALTAVAGFVSWWFTRFVIDDDELRIETGALFKNSKRISFERLQSVDIVQPLVARLFGLAELRLEVGAGDSGVKLRYLSRRKATQLRDYLLARAHGDRSVMASSTDGGQASAFTDLGRDDRPIVTISPGLLVGGFLLSSDWLVSLVFVLGALVVTTFFDVTLYALPGLIPLLLGALSLISRRVIAQFNFTLAESRRGLRITRGLTNLTSQSLPIDRIQGVRISQSLLWKRFGWYRIDVDVLGFGSSTNNEGNNGDVSSILLPVATREQTAAALARVLPGVDLGAVALHRSPQRVRWLRPFDFWTLRYGWTDDVVVAEHGVLIHTRNVVPNAKTQSVRLEQGPLQRRLRMADVHVDTPRGPVNLVAQHLDIDAARELTLSQLERARAARARGPLLPRDTTPPPEVSTGDDAVLAAFGLRGVPPLGGGGEAVVYPLDEHRVLRVYKAGHESIGPGRPESTGQETTPDIRTQLKYYYDAWAQWPIGVELPQILQIGDLPLPDGSLRSWTIDRRMSGRGLTEWLMSVGPGPRRDTLTTYLDTALSLSQLPLPGPGFHRLLGDAPGSFESLPALLDDQLWGGWQRVGDRLRADLPGAEDVLHRLRSEIAERRCEPRLVHGDYFPGNVFGSRTPDGRVVVSGVGDFSPHTLAADPMIDVAGAVVLMQQSYPEALADSHWLAGLAVERLGSDTAHWIDVYRRFYAIYFGDDPSVYPWALAQLRGR
ncbi:MAG: PH domain-containing protein [Propionibacteriaceae bacterium]